MVCYFRQDFAILLLKQTSGKPHGRKKEELDEERMET